MALLDPTIFQQGQPGLGMLAQYNGMSPGAQGGLPPFLPQQQQTNSISNTLLALGAGIASGRDWGEGIGRGLSGAAQVRQQADKERKEMSVKQQAFQGLLAEGMNPQQAWLVANSPEAANYLAQKAQREQAQANADRSFGLQERQFGLHQQEFNRPVVQLMERADGTKVPVLINRNTGEYKVVGGGELGGQPTNPYAAGGKMTEGQSNASLYANRMVESNNVINKFENINADPSGRVAGTAEAMTPNWAAPVFNQIASSDRQQFMQAKRNFINATLRRESGAAISPSEFSNADAQYFPQPGDGPEVLAQKKANRETAIKGIMGAAGPAYKPPSAFKPSGQGGNQGDVLAKAKQAIANGASREKVIQRLRENGIDPSGL